MEVGFCLGHTKRREMIDHTIIKINNFLVGLRSARFEPSQILVLLPRCLQNSECRVNILAGIEKCKRCGRCDIAEIVGFVEKLGIRCHVANGGRRALELARAKDIRLVIACACIKELSAGIRAAFPKPVFAIPNNLPEGACKNTRVNAETIREAIQNFMLPQSI